MTMSRMLRPSIYALAIVALLAAALPASASRRPTKREAADILTALAAANKTCARFPADSCKLGFAVSEANPRWAVAKIRPSVNGENTVAPETISLYRKNRAGHFWAVHEIGNGGGCNMPKRPRRDLHVICLQFSGSPES